MLMAMFEEAWRAMRANRLRTFLTMLGMVIGVGAVVLMMAIGQGAQIAVGQSINSMGSNLFIVLSGFHTSSGARSGTGTGSSLTVDDGAAIADLPGVALVAPVAPGVAQVVWGPNNWNASILGTNPDYLAIRGWPLAAGAPFGDSDMRSATRVALIGQTTAENLFGDLDPVGKTIRVKQSPFLIVGVLSPKGQSLDGRDQDDVLIVPLTTAQRALFGAPQPEVVRTLMVQAESEELMAQLEREITALLRQRHHLREDADNDFFLRNLTAVADTAAEATRILSLLLGAIASVSLLVGGIGIMNIMLVSVTERTREIGIRRALGARQSDVLLQFLLEALIIAVVGCLIGLVLGIGGALAVGAAVGIPVVVGLGPILASLLVAAGTGIFFGYYPARKAAQLDPIEALRYQ